MTLTIQTSDPFESKHQFVHQRVVLQEGKLYACRKYKIELVGKDLFFRKCYVFLCAVTVLPMFFIGLKNFKRLWKSCLSGLDCKIVVVAAKKWPNTPHPYLNKELTPFQEVSQDEVLGLQDLIEVINVKYPKLNLQELSQLLPTDKITIDGVSYYCSKPFKIDTHFGVLGLINVNGKVYPRIFYFSNSQGTWRCMPYALKTEDKGLARLGKGIAENDTQLPTLLNLALLERGLGGLQSSAQFKYQDLLKTEFQPDTAYHKEMNIQELIGIHEGFDKNFFDIKHNMLVPLPKDPKALKMPEDAQKPNFVSLLEKREIILEEYGKVKVKIFPSKDGLLHYTFYETKDKRVFIANIEKVKHNPINSYGLRSEALELHNLDAALLEYPAQVSPDYMPKDPKANRYLSTRYINNWNYISELEIIQEYYISQKRPIPSKV